MHRGWLLACSACWTASLPPPEIPVAKPGRCVVHDANVEISGAAKLSVHGHGFAKQTGAFVRFEVAFAGTIGKAHLENDTFVLDGELDPSDLSIRPREVALHDGWIQIRTATSKSALGTSLKIEVPLPEGLDPKTVLVPLPCTELTYAVPPDPPETTGTPTLVDLPIGTQLRARPDGQPVARVVGYVPQDVPGHTQLRPLEATVLDTRGAMTQVRIEGDNPVVVWAASSALQPPTGDERGGFGFGRSGYGRHQYTCTRDIPIYVRIDGRAVRVGRIKQDAGFYLEGDAGEGDVGIDLGLSEPALVPFINQNEFGSCG